MPELAQNQSFQDPADMTGLDDFFSSHDKPCQEDLTLDEAAKRLNLSERTIQRRLKLGQLMGYKVHGPRGPEWRISLKSSEDTTEQPQLSTEETTTDRVDTTIVDAVTTDDRAEQLNGMGAQAFVQLSDFYRDQIESLQEKLEAATFRNGYLEARLANAEEQLRLLPDLSTKAVKTEVLEQTVSRLEVELASKNQSWFGKFGNWFLGKR